MIASKREVEEKMNDHSSLMQYGDRYEPWVENYLNEHFAPVEFILHVCNRLTLSARSKATACVLYHKAQWEQKKLRENVMLDNYLVAPTCVYLASKIGEEALKIRDLVNISYCVLHPDKSALEIGTTYWKLRDSITTCELMLLRLFTFNVSFTTPQKYVLHFLKSLKDWTSDVTEWEDSHFASICWSLVNDLCYLPLSINVPPHKLALAVIYIGLKWSRLKIVGEVDERKWYKVLCPDTKEEELVDMSCQILYLYKWRDQRT